MAVERVDAVVGGDELGMSLAEELRSLAPFGRGNPAVSLMVADASFRDCRPMGEGKHARFTVHSRGARMRGRSDRRPPDRGSVDVAECEDAAVDRRNHQPAVVPHRRSGERLGERPLPCRRTVGDGTTCAAAPVW